MHVLKVTDMEGNDLEQRNRCIKIEIIEILALIIGLEHTINHVRKSFILVF